MLTWLQQPAFDSLPFELLVVLSPPSVLVSWLSLKRKPCLCLFRLAGRKGAKGIHCDVKRASEVPKIVSHLCQVRQLALLLVRVAGLLSEDAWDQPFVVIQQLKLQTLEKVAR